MHRILIIGAHPDDCDVFAGGTAALWRKRGDVVRFVSMTNGDAGHYGMSREDLARRRRGEAARAAEVIGVDYEVLDNHDGELLPSLERRLEMIRMIREFQPDLVLTHRPNDYHPDHRYTSALVLDSSYMVTVPLICPDVPHLEANPVLAYLFDDFRKPAPFQGDVVIDIDPVADLKWDMLHCHASQYYEWLPFNAGNSEEVPQGDTERRRWLVEEWGPFVERPATSHRKRLAELYGEDRARQIRYAEAFEIGEHGGRPAPEDLRRLFPLP